MSDKQSIWKFLFTTTRGLILLNAGVISIIVAIFGTLSGPMKEWGIAEFVINALHMSIEPSEREGRIVMLYHAIAIAFVAQVVYLILHVVKMDENRAKNIRNIVTIGYLSVVFFGLGFAYWGHNWALHGAFIAGMTLMFYAGVLLTIGLWPWNKKYYVTDKDYAHTRKGVDLERMAFWVMAVATLGSALFGAVPGAYFENGFEVFLAEDGVRHVYHSPLQLAVIGHLHIMLTLIGVAVTLIIGRWFDWKGITHKIGIPLFISGTAILTIGVWSVVPFHLIAHTIIYVGAVFAMTGALMLVIFGWIKMIREGCAESGKRGFFAGVAALTRDPLRFGSLWQMVFMNFCVSGVGIFMAIKLDEIFRVIPFREERITLTGHWHILSVLTGTIVLFYLMSEIFPLKGKVRKFFGWGVIISSDIAFAMITLFSLKRLWVTEEGQQPFVNFTMLTAETGLGVLELLLAAFMVTLVVLFFRRKIIGMSVLLISMSFFAVSCGKPTLDRDPGTVDLKLTVDPESWTQVPAGPFVSGLNEHEAEVPYDYEIMVTEVTYEQYARYLNAAVAADAVELQAGAVAGHYPGDEFHNGRHEIEIPKGTYKYYDLTGKKTRILLTNGKFSVLPGYERFPVAYVTWMGARGYAEFYGWRLPTIFEWEKAARGTDSRSYPFVEEPSEESANYYKSHDPFDKSNGTTPVGFYNGQTHGDFATHDSPGPYGCYDQAGNVAEWIGELHDGSHQRLIYGGSMMEYTHNLRLYTENSSMPEYASHQVGFRCVRGGNPEHKESTHHGHSN
ncbi:SUMF1/EgtB/PvdO family nonheme iron enzyme [PVC group bacterium]|nr:SUMF1/EgtB/PvdO family nonheme iron enzyme [PVC group bacterium]